jgi:4-amino-4-deoxy-L-arabinose transferase-like glycosyltransferase
VVRRLSEAGLIIVLLVVAVVARFWGLQYGLPHSYYPDESSVVGDALRMATTGDPRPTQFLWPTLWIYIVALCLRAGLFVLAPIGAAGPLGQPALDNMTYVYGVARSVTALAGVLSVLGVAAITTRWLRLLDTPGAYWYGIAAGAFLALSPVHVQHSHITSPDVPTVALLMLSAWFALRLFEDGAVRWYVLAGLALGLASAAKYPSAMFAAAIVVAHLGRVGRGQPGGWITQSLRLAGALFDWRLWLAGLLTIAAFLVTSPYILIDWRRFQEDFLPQMNRALQTGSVGGIGLSGPFAWLLFAPSVVGWGVDLPVALLTVVGLGTSVWILVRNARRRPDIVWASAVVLIFPLLLWAFSLSWQQRFARYLLAIIPFACIVAGLGLAGLVRLFPVRAPRSVLVGIVAVLALIWQADGVARYDTLLTHDDTRTIATRWMDANLPPGEPVLVEWYGPPYGNVRQMGFDLSDRPLDRYLGRSPRFVATSSFTYDRWLRDPDRFPRRVAFYQGLDERATRLYEIAPWPAFAYDPVQEGWDGWHRIPFGPEAHPGPVLRLYGLP